METIESHIKDLISQNSDLDNMQISLTSGFTSFKIPSLIKASILGNDELLSIGSTKNLFVLPEADELSYIFAFLKVIHDILNGKINKSYSPADLPIGTHLLLGKSIVEFAGLVKKDNQDMVNIRASDGQWLLRLDNLPFLQKTDNTRPLTKINPFREEIINARNELKVISSSGHWKLALEAYLTYLHSSTMIVAPARKTRELIKCTEISGSQLSDLLLIENANYDGSVSSKSGKLKGTPAVITAIDLYQVLEVINKSHPVQSIIVKIENSNSFNKQLDALDKLLEKDIPVLCITDSANYMDMRSLLDRNFNVWNWNTDLTRDYLIPQTKRPFSTIIKNCSELHIYYAYIRDDLIDTTFKIMSSIKEEAENSSTQVVKIYSELNYMLFERIRKASCVSSLTETTIFNTLCLQKGKKCLSYLDFQ